MARGLVVNGDDFGLTPGVNAGILDAHVRGILTSASLFANAPATGEALELAAGTPALGVGCHLTLVDDAPVLPAARLPTLAPAGRFRSTWGSFVRAALSGRIRLDEVEHELEAQIECLGRAGLRLTHLDSHKHVHAYPPVFDIVVRLARQCGIRSVRVPCDASPIAGLARHWRSGVTRRQAFENLALAPWSWRNRRTLERNGFTVAHFLGRTLTGVFSEGSLVSMLRSVPEGVTELMTHPGYLDAALSRIRTRLRSERAVETSLLTSASVIDVVSREGLSLMRHDGVLFHPHSLTTNRYAS